MLLKMLIAGGLVVATVAMHAVGFDVLLRVIMRSRALDRSGFVPVIGMVIGLTCWLMLIHLAEIAIWGLFYLWHGCLPEVESAFYFSGVTYTTVGYADLVLPRPWRMLAPVEALTGILMYGLSTGLFFAVVSRWISNWVQRKAALSPHAAAPVKLSPVGGKKHLSSLLAAMNILAFLYHAFLDFCDGHYRLIRAALPTRQTFFDDLRALTRYMVFVDWDALMDFMMRGLEIGPYAPKT